MDSMGCMIMKSGDDSPSSSIYSQLQKTNISKSINKRLPSKILSSSVTDKE